MIANFTADVGQSRRTKHAKSRTSKHLSSIFHGFPTPLVDFCHTLENYPLEEIPEKEPSRIHFNQHSWIVYRMKDAVLGTRSTKLPRRHPFSTRLGEY